MIPYHQIAGRLFNRPLLLGRDTALTISGVLLARMRQARGGDAGGDDRGESREIFPAMQRPDGSFEIHTPRTSRFVGEYPLSEDGRGRPEPFRRTADGVGIITTVGELVNRGAWIGASSGLVSYEGFKFQLSRAVADPKTKAIVLDLETPGGEAVGAMEAAAAVRKAAAVKPVVALVDGMAASAGYAIASGASRIVTIPTGISGSIGVVVLHLDYSEFLKTEGIEPTLIFAGAHKVDGNPFEPLPDSVREATQAEVMSFYSDFVATVSAGRKALTAKAIRATEANVFKGRDAVAAGLADEVGTLEDVLADLNRSTRGRSGGRQQGASQMHTDTGEPDAEKTGISKSAHEAGLAKARAEGEKAGALAERERFKAILALDAAKGKEAQAIAIATGTSLSAEEAMSVLAAGGAPTPAAANSLAGRMAAIAKETNVGNPDKDGGVAVDATWSKVVARINGKTR